MKLFVHSVGKFSVDLFKCQMMDAADKNCISSSIGAAITLSLLWLGSEKSTADEIKKAFHFLKWSETLNPEAGPLSGAECDKPGGFHSQFKKLLIILNQHSKYHTLKIASRLYGSISYEFIARYVQCVKDIYNSDLENLDFVNAAEEARQKINAWVESQTNGNIKNFFPPHSLDQSTTMILLNAASFQGLWALPFNPKNTSRGFFWNCKGESMNVDMMTQTGKFNVANIANPSMQVLQLFLEGERLCIYFFVPARRLSTKEILLNLTFEQLEEWTRADNMRNVEVKVSIPKLKLLVQYSLNAAFTKMGMGNLFIPGKANLSGMTGNPQSAVSHINQAFYFSLSEEGVVAAGGSRTEVVDGIYNEVKIDSDFFFMVKDMGTRIILFMGRICDPKLQWLP